MALASLMCEHSLPQGEPSAHVPYPHANLTEAVCRAYVSFGDIDEKKGKALAEEVGP
jgi:hypothetical protein